MGYYPSEDEVLNIINEVRYKNFVNTGETQEFVGLVSCLNCTITHDAVRSMCPISSVDTIVWLASVQSELIRLYINHRPALPLDQHLISAAFDSITDWYDTIQYDTIRFSMILFEFTAASKIQYWYF